MSEKESTSGARITLVFTPRARANIKAVSRDLGMTQQDLVNLVMENINAASIRSIAEAFLKRKEAEQAKARELRARIDALDPAALERMIATMEAQAKKVA